MMNIMEVNKRLRQRPPFQMIEKVLELTPGESARGTKNVCINEIIKNLSRYLTQKYGKGPGVLIIESCAQLCSLVIEDDGVNDDLLYVLLKVDNFKFVKPVIPGDVLDITVTKTKSGGTLAYFDAKVLVDGEVRAKGSMVFTAVPKENVYK